MQFAPEDVKADLRVEDLLSPDELRRRVTNMRPLVIEAITRVRWSFLKRPDLEELSDYLCKRGVSVSKLAQHAFSPVQLPTDLLANRAQRRGLLQELQRQVILRVLTELREEGHLRFQRRRWVVATTRSPQPVRYKTGPVIYRVSPSQRRRVPV